MISEKGLLGTTSFVRQTFNITGGIKPEQLSLKQWWIDG